MVIDGDLVRALFVLPWVILPVVVAARIWFRLRRGGRLKAWAAASGWTYVGRDRSLVDRWQGEPFGKGDSRTASEVLVGRWAGRPAVSFTYSFRTGTDDHETTSTYHVVALPLPAYLPTLELTPEGFGTRLASMLGRQDIQFESEEFNRAWRVESRDLKFAHDVVHPRLMERLMRPDARGVCLRIGGTDILTWTEGGTDLDRIAVRLGLMTTIIESVPRYVWQDHGHDPGPVVSRPGLEGQGPR